MSQEELALETGVSPRHLSFLETGRSQPGRSMVLSLAGVFGLAPQDLNTLMVAAGFAADPEPVDLGQPSLRWLHKSLDVHMRMLDPWSAAVHDKYGNLQLVNRGWLALHRELVSADALAPPLNVYHLFFADNGLRPHLVEWEDVACRLLMTLQQEVLLGADTAAESLLAQLLAYPSIPANWRQRGAEIAHQHSFRVHLRLADGGTRNYLNTVNTVGATPYVGEPRLLISVLAPENLEPDFSRGQLLSDASLLHPLLHY